MIKFQYPPINLKTPPNFLIIGPHRCGTSWLYTNLSLHPQIFFARPKEIHFFCKHENLRPHVCRSSNDLNGYLSLFSQTPREYFRESRKVWKQHKEFYLPKVRGEATACYATLDKTTIQKIVALNPNIKVILTIRNPIDRAWSHAKLLVIKVMKKKLENVSHEELKNLLQQDFIINGGLYTKIINNWYPFLKKGNFLVEFLNNIKESPEELLLNMYSFLGVRSDSKYIGEKVGEKINTVASDVIPEQLKIMLAEIYSNEIKQLKKDFNISCENGVANSNFKNRILSL